MDYIFHLKEENGDLFHRLAQKAKPGFDSFVENEKVQEISDKTKEFLEDRKPQIEKLQSKEEINTLVNGIAKILAEVEIEAEKQKIKDAAESMELPSLDEIIAQGD